VPTQGERRVGNMAAVSDIFYDPQRDVEALAQHLTNDYGSLDRALRQFDPDAEFTQQEFEVWLRKWGLADKVDPISLFDYIDKDVSFTISVDELFSVLSLPADRIQQRKKDQHEREMHLIFKAFAKGIHEHVGSIEDYFAKQLKQGAVLQEDAGPLGHSSPSRSQSKARLSLSPGVGSIAAAERQMSEGAQLSFAQFSRFADVCEISKHLPDEQLAARCLDRVFGELDKDRSGGVSVEEIQIALRDYIVRDTLADIAQKLHQDERYKSVAGAFEKFGAAKGLSHASMGAEGLDELKRVLRFLCPGHSALESEETLKMLHKSINPFSSDELKKRLEMEHHRVETEQKVKNDAKEQRDKSRKDRMRRQIQTGAEVVENQLDRWIQRSGKDAHGKDGPAEWSQRMKQWSIDAKTGKSRSQLADHISALNNMLQKKETEAEDFRRELKEPVLLRRSAASLSTMKHRSKNVQAAKIVQAASVGDLVAVQALVSEQIDVNAVSWGGITPLMTAARHGRTAVMVCLLEARAALDRTDSHGRTALDHAYRQPAALEWLKAHGAPAGEQLKLQAEHLAQRVMEVEAERVRLTSQKNMLGRAPSRLHRAATEPDVPSRSPSYSPSYSPDYSPRDLIPGSMTSFGAFSGAYSTGVAALFNPAVGGYSGNRSLSASAGSHHGGYSRSDMGGGRGIIKQPRAAASAFPLRKSVTYAY